MCSELSPTESDAVKVVLFLIQGILLYDHLDSNDYTIHLDYLSLEIEVRCQRLPVGAGLGSSAALSVALAAALLKIQQKIQKETSESKSQRAKVKDLSPCESEKVAINEVDLFLCYVFVNSRCR